MDITREELMTLSDICREANKGLHSRQLYEALFTKGLIFKTLGGEWRPTEAGKGHCSDMAPKSTR